MVHAALWIRVMGFRWVLAGLVNLGDFRPQVAQWSAGGKECRRLADQRNEFGVFLGGTAFSSDQIDECCDGVHAACSSPPASRSSMEIGRASCRERVYV